METIKNKTFQGKHICFPYYHSFPDKGAEEFCNVFSSCIKYKEYISRIQVTNEVMRGILLDAGFPEKKIQKIYIPVDIDIYKQSSLMEKKVCRENLGIPYDAFVIGSFQKDGNGWEEGYIPKYIKGPDILVGTLGQLKKRIPNLHVLLSGPARGYVKRKLKQMGISYTHILCDNLYQVAELFHALDVYFIPSRQEGGPKGLLESMASGIPVVSTNVGQVPELAVNGESVLMAEDDIHLLPLINAPEKPQNKALALCDQLSDMLFRIYEDEGLSEKLIVNGLNIARANHYLTQADDWATFYRMARSGC